MDRRRRIAVTVTVVLLAALGAAAIGVVAYQAGVSRGLADAGRLPGLEAPGWPYPHHGPRWGGPLGVVVPVLGLLLGLVLLRGLFGHRGCRGAAWWSGPGGVPPAFAEWHRRAHEGSGEAGPGSRTTA